MLAIRVLCSHEQVNQITNESVKQIFAYVGSEFHSFIIHFPTLTNVQSCVELISRISLIPEKLKKLHIRLGELEDNVLFFDIDNKELRIVSNDADASHIEYRLKLDDAKRLSSDKKGDIIIKLFNPSYYEVTHYYANVVQQFLTHLCGSADNQIPLAITLTDDQIFSMKMVKAIDTTEKITIDNSCLSFIARLPGLDEVTFTNAADSSKKQFIFSKKIKNHRSFTSATKVHKS